MSTSRSPLFLFTDEGARDEQARLAILPTTNHRRLAASCKVTEETVSRWAHGAWLMPTYRAGQVARIQDDWTFLQSILARNGRIIGFSQVALTHQATRRLLANLTISFSRFFELTHIVQEGQKMTADELREFEMWAAKLIENIQRTVLEAQREYYAEQKQQAGDEKGNDK